MAWYPLPQNGTGALSAGDEFFENQSSGWSLWSFTSSDEQTTAPAAAAAAYPAAKHETDAARSEEEPVPALLEPQLADDIFLSQFSDEEMRRMEAPFEALDMFPGSMHRLLSYEDMLSGVLAGDSSEEQQEDAKVDRNGVDAMDTCGFPLFSHDLQNAEITSQEVLPDTTLPMDKAEMCSTIKRSRSFVDGEGCFEGLVLEELEDVVFQLTKKTRICFRDAFFRMAETSSKAARCTSASASGSGRQGVQQAAEGNAPRVVPAAVGCPERATNAIDRTVADMTMRPPCPAPLQVDGSCFAGGSSGAEPEAQSTTTWTARA